jgi:hypothetical protein
MRRALCIALLAVPTLIQAQAQQPAPRPALDFSGLLFGNFAMRSDSAARFSTGGKPASRFDIGRAYLNFRIAAGERASIRVTTDIFQQTGAAAAYYAGWTIRLKYGYLQYDATQNLAGIQGLATVARIGMLQNVVVEHIDSYWPRFLGQNAVETHGFFASADVGAATLLTMPKRRGEVYITLMNGSNYTAAENDRFKDVAARFSFTPFGNDSGFFRTLAITPWYSKGWSASQFVTGGVGQVGPVSDGLQKDRRGLFAGVRDRRFTGGAEYSQRLEEIETGANTVANPRAVASRHRDLVSGFALVRPTEIFDSRKRSRFGLLGRYDKFDIDNTTTAANEIAWFGVFWDLTSRTTFTVDYQELNARGGSATIPTKTLFMHWVVSF